MHTRHTDAPTPGSAGGRSHGPKRYLPHAVMWAAIALSLALFGLLLALGWDGNAATTAAAALLVACAAVCIWAGAQGRIAEREVDRAIAQMAAAREADGRRRGVVGRAACQRAGPHPRHTTG